MTAREFLDERARIPDQPRKPAETAETRHKMNPYPTNAPIL